MAYRREPPERCTKLSARTVAKNAKSHSSQIRVDPSIAETAGPKNETKDEDTRKLVISIL